MYLSGQVPGTGRSLGYGAIDYDQALNHLQDDIQYLRQTMICDGSECLQRLQCVSCSNSRFGLSATMDRHATGLLADFSRINTGCVRLLSGMMSLNLL